MHHLGVFLRRGDQKTALCTQVDKLGVVLLGPGGKDTDNVVDTL